MSAGIMPEDHNKPVEGIDGWIDKIHLALLSDADKRQIRRLQRQTGLPISDLQIMSTEEQEKERREIEAEEAERSRLEEEELYAE